MFNKMIYCMPKGTDELIVGFVQRQNNKGDVLVKMINTPFFTKTFDECILNGQRRIIYSAFHDGNKRVRTYWNNSGSKSRFTVMDEGTGVFQEHILDKSGAISRTKEVLLNGRVMTERVVDAFGNLLSRSERTL